MISVSSELGLQVSSLRWNIRAGYRTAKSCYWSVADLQMVEIHWTIRFEIKTPGIITILINVLTRSWAVVL